ncbi:bifunctional acetate--CoA ligase family protein/GNAT family N-acetyltransferase [bacterium]|nr:bifunctional acetate--CoA ligase family protein/GNAT family N-acetyltransferase [bacterium]
MEHSTSPVADRAHDVLRFQHQPLDAIFAPKNVAVIGATEKQGSVGRTILWNLISNPFGGTVFPVNLKRSNVLGIKAYRDVKSVPELIDLAVIVTPAPTVPDIINQCVDAGVKGVIVISAGFKEIGKEGVKLEDKVLQTARRGGVRLIGPNCLGVMRPYWGLNATFASTMAAPGNVGFISQSGALCTAILDWSFHENVGFSAFISIGSMLDVDWGDLIYYLGSDPQTKSIIIYMESIGDARSFLSAAREVALTKPIIVIKAGRTEAAAKAAASHTGALAGSDDVLNAAFRRSGVLRVERIAELFYMSELLAKQPRPKGPRLTILTNAGGPAVLATDALIEGGGELAQLSQEASKSLDAFLPAHWSHNNPIDILGDADSERYTKAIDAVAKDSNSDGLLVILTPQAMTRPTQTAEQMRPYASIGSKPILASWMGEAEVAAGNAILNRYNIPTFSYPDTAARMFNYMWRYSYNLRGLYETPALPSDSDEGYPDREAAEQIIQKARNAKRTILTEHESKQLLTAYDIPTIETRVAKDQAEACEIANALGYPVVLKLHSETITHKTDFGGVRLSLTDKSAVLEAYQAIEASVGEKTDSSHFNGVTVQPMIHLQGYEIIIGSSVDPQFGPVLLFGAGGQLVEVFRDRALALPPLNTTLARRMMEQTKIYTALKGVRGREPVNLPALEKLMVRFSQLVVEQNWIKEVDINPLLASSDGLYVLDARVVLHDPSMDVASLPRPAIRPYPAQYTKEWKTRTGEDVMIRPVRPEDEPLMIHFHEQLSSESVYLRYFLPMSLSARIAHERLSRICFIDYDREMALVAERKDPESVESEILAVGRLSKIRNSNVAEFAILVSDKYQKCGLGTELLSQLIQVGKDEKIGKIIADILPENQGMRRVCQKLGFSMHHDAENKITKAELHL